MTNLTIRIEDDLKKQLTELSKAQNRAVSDVVRDSLRRYIAVQRLRAIRGRLLPLAEAQGLLTDEDVFEAIS